MEKESAVVSQCPSLGAHSSPTLRVSLEKGDGGAGKSAFHDVEKSSDKRLKAEEGGCAFASRPPFRCSRQGEQSAPEMLQLPVPSFLLSRNLVETYRRSLCKVSVHKTVQSSTGLNHHEWRPKRKVPPRQQITRDLILTVRDILDPNGGAIDWENVYVVYKVLDLLGKGTFGQVVQCRSFVG